MYKEMCDYLKYELAEEYKAMKSSHDKHKHLMAMHDILKTMNEIYEAMKYGEMHHTEKMTEHGEKPKGLWG